MTSRWYSILGPNDWPGVKLETGNPLIDTTYKNILSSDYVSLAASGTMYLTSGSGIRLITPGYVDASGIRATEIAVETIKSIDSSGNIVETYPGPTGGFLYKVDDFKASSNDFFTLNDSNQVTLPTVGAGAALWSNPSGNVLESYGYLKLIDKETLPPPDPTQDAIVIPPTVLVSGENVKLVTEQIQIGQPFPYFRGSVLTHTGEDGLAAWAPADYLKADGVLFNRYPKRAAYVYGASEAGGNSKVYIVDGEPDWASLDIEKAAFEQEQQADGQVVQDTNFFLALAEAVANAEETGLSMEKEFQFNDTIALVKADSRDVVYAKIASTVTFFAAGSGNVNLKVDTNPVSSNFTDSLGDTHKVKILEICGRSSEGGTKVGYSEANDDTGLGSFYGSTISGIPDGAYYAYSVTRGAYLSMQLDPEATNRFYCGNFQDDTFTFKPSTLNNISIRPDVSTGFNLLAENIDFAIYGKKLIEYNNYDEDTFELNDSHIPEKINPAFYVDAFVPNACSGVLGSGVFVETFLNMERTRPSGYVFDHNPKICINTYKPHIISTIDNIDPVDIPFYQLPFGETDTAAGSDTDFSLLKHYADVTIKGITYSDSIITEQVYLPKPDTNLEGEYVANALLTLDKNGKIISRIARTNPVAPNAPSNIEIEAAVNGSVSLSWEEPDDDGGKPIANYVIEFSANDGVSYTEIFDDSSQAIYFQRGTNIQTDATIIGLSPGVSYILAVKAQNEIDIGAAVTAGPLTIADYNSPSVPRNGYVERVFGTDNNANNTSRATLFWQSPSSIGTSSVDGYLIEFSIDYGKTWSYYNLPTNLVNETRSISNHGSISELNGFTWEVQDIYGLDNKKNYWFRVSALNSSGQSSFLHIYSHGNIPADETVEAIERQQEKEAELLSNWDFGTVLFTGVCT
jgi:hypothetical protein